MLAVERPIRIMPYAADCSCPPRSCERISTLPMGINSRLPVFQRARGRGGQSLRPPTIFQLRPVRRAGPDAVVASGRIQPPTVVQVSRKGLEDVFQSRIPPNQFVQLAASSQA